MEQKNAHYMSTISSVSSQRLNSATSANGSYPSSIHGSEYALSSCSSSTSTSSSLASSVVSTRHRFNPTFAFHNFIESFKPFDYSSLPPVYLDHFQLNSQQTKEFGEELNTQHGNPAGTQVKNQIGSGTSPNLHSLVLPRRSQLDGSNEAALHPAHPNFDYSQFTQLERDAIITAMSPLSKKLRARHLTWISLGASIGTGLFITLGVSLHHAGPLGLLLVWMFIGSLVFATMSSLSELATAFPVSGAFVTFPTLFIDKSLGFAIAWNYALQWLITMPLELVAASMCIQYWRPDLNPAIFVTVFYVVIVFINLFGIKGYGEIESVMSLIKVIAVIGFNILAVIIVAGGVPGQPYIGGANWHQPQGGLFNSHSPFKQMCYIISNVSFAFAGLELFALGAVESATPKISINKSRKWILYQIVIFYLVSIVMIGCLVSYKNPQLDPATSRDGGLGIDVNTSPFVIAIRLANIHAGPSIMNAATIITVVSVGNASVYASTRVLCAVGALRQGPKFLRYIDRKGRPMGCLVVQFLFGLLGYLVCVPGRTTTAQIFAWLLSLSGLSALFTYLSINLSHLRFRQALYHQARSPKLELLYTSPVWCSWYAIVTTLIALVLQFWAALWPPGSGSGTGGGGGADVKSFFQVYLSLPVFLLSYVAHKVYDYYWNGVPLFKLWLAVDEIDVDSGRRQVDLEVVKQEIAERANMLETKPWWFRLYHFFC